MKEDELATRFAFPTTCQLEEVFFHVFCLSQILPSAALLRQTPFISQREHEAPACEFLGKITVKPQFQVGH